jgi:hypothetical protein
MLIQIKIQGSNHYTNLKYVPLEQYPYACIWVSNGLMSTHCLFYLCFVLEKIDAILDRGTCVLLMCIEVL